MILLGYSGVLGNIKEDFSVFSSFNITEIGNCELGILNLGLKVGAGKFGGGGTDSLEDPVDNIILSSATGELLLLTVPINER